MVFLLLFISFIDLDHCVVLWLNNKAFIHLLLLCRLDSYHAIQKILQFFLTLLLPLQFLLLPLLFLDLLRLKFLLLLLLESYRLFAFVLKPFKIIEAFIVSTSDVVVLTPTAWNGVFRHVPLLPFTFLLHPTRLVHFFDYGQLLLEPPFF